MIARVFEEMGLTTVNIALVREHAEAVKPPRALTVPFPFGFALGRALDPDFQHRVLGAALGLLGNDDTPVLAVWPEDETRQVRLVQASHVERKAPDDVGPANELTKLRAFYERWVEANDGRTAVGLSGVPERQFRKLVRFLQAYSEGDEAADVPERPRDVSVHQYMRYAVDDLKAFYYEARMAQRDGVAEPELHEWFWGETAMGALVAAVAAHMGSAESAAIKSIGNGIAR